MCEIYGFTIKKDYDFATGFYKNIDDLKDKFWLTELTVKYHNTLEKDLIQIGFELVKYYHNDGNPEICFLKNIQGAEND
ncbi:MAG: hypothetical protein JEZ08_25385 [Clostridiales bacterium]|nr:hypothetical protein [Clostridiales bacterium]